MHDHSLHKEIFPKIQCEHPRSEHNIYTELLEVKQSFFLILKKPFTLILIDIVKKQNGHYIDKIVYLR